MKIEQFRASSLERTVLFPFLTEYLAPRNTEAGFQDLAEQQSIEQHPHRRPMPSDGGLGNELLQFLRGPTHYSLIERAYLDLLEIGTYSPIL